MKRKVIEELEALLEDDILVEEDETDVSEEEEEEVVDEEEKATSKGVIEALRDTDYKDKDAFFKMVQLLRGLAALAEEDEIAKKYLSGVSDALTDVAKKVLGEK